MNNEHGFGRRELLVHASVWSVAATGLSSGMAQAGEGEEAGAPTQQAHASTGGFRIMLDKVTKASFSEHLGTTFRIRHDGGDPLEVTLVDVSGLGEGGGSRPDSDRREPFSIVFRGPKAPCLPQKIYKMEHDALGSFGVFIVPVGCDAKGTQYEVIFN